MTATQVIEIVCHPRTPKGELDVQAKGDGGSLRDDVREFCFLNGIDDPRRIDRIYQARRGS